MVRCKDCKHWEGWVASNPLYQSDGRCKVLTRKVSAIKNGFYIAAPVMKTEQDFGCTLGKAK